MVIHIFGASGSGTSTLGEALAAKIGAKWLDTDDFYWLPTAPKFTKKRPPVERLARLTLELARNRDVVLSGSLSGWGDPLIPRFSYAIRLVTDTDTRLERLKAREYERFGERIREGGDMYVQHREFLDWAAKYDDGSPEMRSRAHHDEWQKKLLCPFLTLDGTKSPDENAAFIERKIKFGL